MNKFSFTALSLVLLLATGCFDDSRQNKGLNGKTQQGLRGDPDRFNGNGNDDDYTANTGGPFGPGNTGYGNGDRTGDGMSAEARKKAAELEAAKRERDQARRDRVVISSLKEAYRDIVPADERSVSDESTLWQSKCLESNPVIDPEATPNSDTDRVGDACEGVNQMTQTIHNGWIATIMVMDADILLKMIKIKIQDLIKRAQNSNNPDAAMDRQTASDAQKELQRFGGTGNKVENVVNGTSDLDRLVGLWLTLGKQYYKSDLAIYKELYARLRDPKQGGGDPDRGSKLFLNPNQHPNDLLQRSDLIAFSGDVNQPFAVLEGGYENGEQVFVAWDKHLSASPISIRDFGGAGSSMATVENTKNKAIIAIYEGFAERDFDIALMNVTPQGAGAIGQSLPMEGLAAFYAGGNLVAYSASVGSGLGTINAFLGKSRSLKINQENALVEGNIRRNSPMAAIFINLEKAPTVPINFFAQLSKTPEDVKQYEALPLHVSRLCPYSAQDAQRLIPSLQYQTDERANRLITFEALNYCPGYNDYLKKPCAPTTPGKESDSPCAIKNAISAADAQLNQYDQRIEEDRLTADKMDLRGDVARLKSQIEKFLETDNLTGTEASGLDQMVTDLDDISTDATAADSDQILVLKGRLATLKNTFKDAKKQINKRLNADAN